MLEHLGSPSGSVRVPPYSTGIWSGSMYFCRTSFQLAGGVEDSGVWGAVTPAGSPSLGTPPRVGISTLGGTKAEGDVAPRFRLLPHTPPPARDTLGRGSGLTSQDHDFLAGVLAQEVLDEVVGNREDLGGWGADGGLGR